MYCVVFSLKNWYDAKDMRATGGNDVNFAMDAPKVDSPDIADARGPRAPSSTPSPLPTTSAGRRRATAPPKAKSVLPDGNLAYGAWGGQTCNPYDTERVPRGTSGGSGSSVAANLVACSICEQSGGLVQGTGLAEQRRQPPDHQGHTDGRRHTATRMSATAPASTAARSRMR